MMEVNNYAGKGWASLNTVLGSIGTAGALGVLNGGLGGILGGGNGAAAAAAMCSENHLVNRYEAEKDARIAELETEVKLRDANTYTDQKLGALRDYVDSKFSGVQEEICNQRVYNATNTAAIGCIQGQVAQLQAVIGGLTKTVVPNSSICPGWGDVTVSVKADTAASA